MVGASACTSSASDNGSVTPTSSILAGPRDTSPFGEPFLSSPDKRLTVGERRLLPVHLHCGIARTLEINERHWALAETPTGAVPETGAGDRIPDQWPTDSNGALLGYIGLGEDDVVRYSLPDGTVLAVYRPTEAPAEPVGCG